MIRKLKSGKYRLYSRKVDPKTASEETWAPSALGQRQRNMNAPYNTSNVKGDSDSHPTTRAAGNSKTIP